MSESLEMQDGSQPADNGAENSAAEPANGNGFDDNGEGSSNGFYGLVNQVSIEQEMRTAYLDYAMSVIVARALPDARDGLKPVHRRILYAMYDMGLTAGTSYKKRDRKSVV